MFVRRSLVRLSASVSGRTRNSLLNKSGSIPQFSGTRTPTCFSIDNQGKRFGYLASSSFSTTSSSGSNNDGSAGLQPIIPKQLKDVVKMELFDDQSPEDVRRIWDEYFKLESTKDTTGTSISKEDWSMLKSRIETWKENGAFYVLYAEWKDSNLIMTFLEDYKSNPHTAPTWFHVVPHREYLDTKNIVLVQAEYLPYLSKEEAATLLSECLSFYLQEDKYKHVEKFNLESHNFDFTAAFGIKF